MGGPANVTLTFSGGGSPLVYFRERVLTPQDRLGSIGKYYPYGEEKGTATANDALKFATYTRDAATGLDYADQRYYSSQFGRFMSADPYMASGGAGDPGSWNRYAYVGDDPSNYYDPAGLFKECPPGSHTGKNCIVTIDLDLGRQPEFGSKGYQIKWIYA